MGFVDDHSPIYTEEDAAWGGAFSLIAWSLTSQGKHSDVQA